MTAISWKNAVNGDWNNPSNWSTNTVPGGNDDATISALGPYIVTISSAVVATLFDFNAPQAALYENAGSLTTDGLTVDSGFVSLNEANTLGGVEITGGVLAFSNSGALGDGPVILHGGQLVATATETLTNSSLSFSGSSTIAAAHGTTLDENSSDVIINTNATLNFGAPGRDGVILWHAASYTSTAPVNFNVVAGTLKVADASLYNIFYEQSGSTTIFAGATLDTGGFGLSLTDLLGGGAIVDSGAADTLVFGSANFSGVIAGPQSVIALDTLTLSGANTYTGTTTIDGLVSVGIDGATGSLGSGAVTINGSAALDIDRDNALTLTNAISGAGTLGQEGEGVTSINTANFYTGGTALSAGTLAIGDGGALGSGPLAFTGGELLGTATETFAGAINLVVGGFGVMTFAAAHGATLKLTGAVNVEGNNVVVIGAPGQDGDVLWEGATDWTTGDLFDVRDGTLTAGAPDIDLGQLLFGIAGTRVQVGATIDWAGTLAGINNLQGAGTVTNSGAAQTLDLEGTTNFSGTISGALSLLFGEYFQGYALLSGLEDFTGGATFDDTSTVVNAGTYDIVSNNGIAGTPVSLFVNNGLFEKTGGGGVSQVTSNIANDGFLDVQSGSMQFSGGFTNDGVIHGLVTQSGGVTTIAKAPNYVAMGGGETIDFADSSGDTASLYDTAGDFDTLYGSKGSIYLYGAQANVVGGGDTIYFSGASGNLVVLFGTSSNWDSVYGSGGTVELYSAQASVTGGGDAIYFAGGTGNAASLYGTGGSGDAVYGSSGTVYLTSAQASIIGGGDTVYFSGGSGNSANLSGTGGNSDTVYGSNGTVYLTSAQVSAVGGSDTIYFYGGSGNTASLFGTGGHSDTVYGSNGSIALTGAQVSVVGGGDTTYFSGGTGNVASLFGTNGVWDTVYGASGTVALTGSQASVIGNGNSIDFYGTNNWLSASGGSEAFVFQPAIGHDTINSFAASDSMQFSKSDFANFAALSPHISQSGSNTLISLDANDTVTLTNTLASSLTSAQFHFV